MYDRTGRFRHRIFLAGVFPRFATLAAAWLFLVTFSWSATASQAPRPGAAEQMIAKTVAEVIGRYHYLSLPLDDTLSKQLFEEYFDRLDHEHSVFLASDIEEFRSYQTILDDLLRKGKLRFAFGTPNRYLNMEMFRQRVKKELQGNIDFAFDVYARFQQRLQERTEYVQQRLEQPFDFDKDEVILLDRSKEPWCKTKAELDALWRRRLKNNLLVYEMMSLNEEEAEKKEEATSPLAKPERAVGEGQEPTPVTAEEAKKQKTVSPPKTPKQRVIQFYERYLRRYQEKDPIDIAEIFLSVFTRIYDCHSAYMAPDTEEDFDISMKLSLQGIGAMLTTEDAFVKVVRIMPGGPAEADGRLKEADRIIAVAQEDEEAVDVIDMSLHKVVRKIRGPKGTHVYLTVLEEGKRLGSVPTVIDIVRGEVKLTEQEAKSEVRSISLPAATAGVKAQKAAVAVIALPSFYSDFGRKKEGAKDYKSSSRDLRRLIDDARKDGLSGMILDLRSNGGGSLDEAISLAGLFFAEGPVVQVRVKRGQVYKRNDPDKETVYDGPLVVLVDRLSASASEIVAAALQDYHRAVIVGEHSTHGKGTVQTVFHLNKKLKRSPIFAKQEAGSLKFTTAKFYRVTGGSTQVKGVTPDIILPSFTDHMELGEEHLPHVLPWDEIDMVKVACDVDVRPYLPTLSERSQRRLASNKDFQEYLQYIDKFAERRKRKTLSINRGKRTEKQKEDKAWTEKMKTFNLRKKRNKDPKVGEKKTEAGAKEAEPEDFMLVEALQIMGDLIVLQGGGTEFPAVELTVSGEERAASSTLDAASRTGKTSPETH